MVALRGLMEVPMALRHENALLSRLESVIDKGYTNISATELLIWYNQERLTVNIWRDIADKWYNVLETTAHLRVDAKITPLLIANRSVDYVLIWGYGLTCSDESWFKDIRTLARMEF